MRKHYNEKGYKHNLHWLPSNLPGFDGNCLVSYDTNIYGDFILANHINNKIWYFLYNIGYHLCWITYLETNKMFKTYIILL
jgi:hypothetical protein